MELNGGELWRTWFDKQVSNLHQSSLPVKRKNLLQSKRILNMQEMGRKLWQRASFKNECSVPSRDSRAILGVRGGHWSSLSSVYSMDGMAMWMEQSSGRSQETGRNMIWKAIWWNWEVISIFMNQFELGLQIYFLSNKYIFTSVGVRDQSKAPLFIVNLWERLEKK